MAAEGMGRTGAHFDAIVIGGGINGLVAACLLGKAGKRTLLLEASDRLGGMAASVSPDGKVSEPGMALLGKPLSAALAARLGLALESERLDQLCLLPGGERLYLPGDDAEERARAVARHSANDAARLAGFNERLGRLSAGLAPFLDRAPPRVGGGWRDRGEFARLAFSIRRMGRADMRDLLRIIAMNSADLLEEVFESDAVQGLYAFDSLLGNRFGPRSPNTVYTLLHRWATTNERDGGAPLRPKGGAVALVRALMDCAAKNGVTLRAGAPVERLLVEDDRVKGVSLAGGESLKAGQVFSSLHPARSCLDLLGPEHLDADAVRDLRFARGEGANAAVSFRLSALPDLGLPAGRTLRTRMVSAPSIAALEEAHDASKYGELPEHPAFEAAIVEENDSVVLQATLQACPARLKTGDWSAAKEGLERSVLDRLEAVAPGLKERVEESRFHSPAEIGEQLGAPGGHWHHLEMGLDQSYLLRPTPGFAQYRTPVGGFVLCGAGCHPGGGLSGAAGAIAVAAALGEKKGGLS